MNFIELNFIPTRKIYEVKTLNGSELKKGMIIPIMHQGKRAHFAKIKGITEINKKGLPLQYLVSLKRIQELPHKIKVLIAGSKDRERRKQYNNRK